MAALRGHRWHRILVSLGFTFAHKEVDTIIAGTHNPEHMKTNIDWVNSKLPIDEAVVQELWRRFDEVGQDWMQLG